MSYNVSIDDIKKLRSITSCGLSDCRNALIESEGDFDKAVQILRKKGLKVADKRSGNATNQGFMEAISQGGEGVIVSLSCETDFVARTDVFRNFVSKLAKIALEKHIKNLDELNNLEVDNVSVSTHILDLISKLGENIKLGYDVLAGEKVCFYNHYTGNLSVLVSLNNVGSCKNIDEVGRNVAMHICALNPISVDRTSVSESVIAAEKEVVLEQSSSAKNDLVKEKMVAGKLDKFFKENVLLEQKFVCNNDITIQQYLNENGGVCIDSFKRFNI